MPEQRSEQARTAMQARWAKQAGVHVQTRNQAKQERARLERDLQTLHARIDAAYIDKLDGKISEEFWHLQNTAWATEEFRIKSRIAGLVKGEGEKQMLNIERILELAQNAHSLYLTRKLAEQAQLLQKVLLNCSIDAVSLYPTYIEPFGLIFNRAKN
jgi:hypothetical protein